MEITMGKKEEMGIGIKGNEFSIGMPENVGLDHLNTNEVFFSQNFDIMDESNIADKPYYMDVTPNVGATTGVSPDILDKDIQKEVEDRRAYDEFTASKEEVSFTRGEFVDDGRKVADMNIEGLKLIYSSLLAALLVAGAFIGAFALFLLFCINVWFK